MSLLKNKAVWSFIGGALAVTVGKDVVTSKKAKKLYAEGLAKGFMIKDNLQTTYEDIQEEAMDIYEDAKEIHRKELLVEPSCDDICEVEDCND